MKPKHIMSYFKFFSLASLASVAYFAVAALFTGCYSVPYTGRHHMLLISQSEELQMGRDAYAQVLKESKLSDDPGQTRMVKRIGEKLAKISNAPPEFEWEFNLIQDDKQVNAFCLPGGKVAVYTALLPVSKDETGLSVVMGHEIAHALARHGSERMSQNMVAGIGGKLLGAVLATKSPAVQDAFGKAYGVGVGVGFMLPFSRAHESEADHIGLLLMAKAGYDPHSAVDFWGRMSAATKAPDSPLAKYMSTHPNHGTRIKDIENWIPEAMGSYQSGQ